MLPGYPTRNWYRKSEIRGVQAAFKVTKRRVLYDRHQFSDSSCSSLWSPGTRMHPPHCRPRIESYEREVKVDATVCGTSEPGEDLRSFSQSPVYPDSEPYNELHRRRPSQEVCPPPPVSPGPDYLGPQQAPTHPQQLQRRPHRPVLGELRPGLPQGGPPQRRGSVCDQTALGRMAGPPGSTAGGEQEDQGLRGQGAAAESRGPGEPQDRPGGGPRDSRGGPQRAGRHQPIPQRQDRLRLRGTGAGGPAERGEEVQGPEDHQGRLGTVAVGTGGGSLATGWQKPEMGGPVLSVDASQR